MFLKENNEGYGGVMWPESKQTADTTLKLINFQ